MDRILNFGQSKTLYCLENAIITPTIINSQDKTFTGCVYDHAGKLIPASQRSGKEVIWKPVDPDPLITDEITDEIEGRCIYLGHYTGHYGHFLLETLARFWVLQTNIEYDKVIFQPFVHHVPEPKSFSPAKICFECFGIKYDRMLIVNNCLKVKDLCVPNPLIEIKNKADDEQALIYQQIAEYCQHRFGHNKEPLFSLSRSKFQVLRENSG
ncbi:glycosyltransferase family 61 protein [Chloroflexi bacterium TSY]|nr:glycosyltransferase family 61 protein [Chloroflexi bacterium TSY]